MPDLAKLLQRWPQIGALLDEALEMPTAQRQEWLAARTDLPEALRALLGDLLARDAAAPREPLLASQDVARAASAVAPLQPGSEVGPYRLVRVLGQGGMGSVWLAERSDGLIRRPVALKLPHVAWTSALAQRLERERDILAGLQHPKIARLLDAGVDALGRPYLALEHVEGEPIDTWCAQRAAPLRQQLELLLQVADAVAYAHSCGVLHRDIKPANILVTADAQVRLLDFGIAKLMHEGQSVETALTLEVGRAMSIEYASPEQQRGEPLGAGSDIYSLGVVAYELLAGVRPERAKAEADSSAPAVPASERTADPARRRLLRGDLDAILLKAMHAQAPQRYASADALAQDLQRHLRGEPVQARPATPALRLARHGARLLARHRLLAGMVGALAAAAVLALGAGATATVFALLAAGALVAAWQAARARQQSAEALRQAARARAIQHFLQGIFEPLSLDHGDAVARQRLTAGDLLVHAAAQLSAGRLGGDLALAADLQGVVGKLLHDLALTDPAIEMRRLRLTLLQRTGAPVQDRAAALADLAESLHQRGELADAEQRMAAALGLLAGAAGRDAAVRHALLSVRLANMQMSKGADEASLQRLNEAIVRLRRLAPGSAELADALAILATVLSEHQHQMDRAYEVALEALALLERGDDQRMRAARLHYQIGLLLFVQRRYGEAETETQRALDIYRRLAGEQHPTTAIVALALARQLSIHGRLDESVPLIRQALPVLEAAGAGIDPMHLAEGRMALGEALLEEGRVAEALPMLANAVAALRSLAAPIPLTVCALLLARAQAESGQHAEALQLLHEVLEIRTGLWGAEHSSTALVLQRIGVVHMWAGRHDEAESWLRRVAGSGDVREQSFGSVKHRAAATLMQLDLERGHLAAVLAPATALRDAMLALPPEQRMRALRINTEVVWARAMLGLGRVDELEPAMAALTALSGELYPGAPQRLMVWAVRTRWLALQQRAAEAREALATTEAGFALQPLSAHYRRLLDEARAALQD